MCANSCNGVCSHHVEAVLLEGSTENGRVGLIALERRVITGLHLHCGCRSGCFGNTLKEAKLYHTDVLLLAQDTNTSTEARKQGLLVRLWTRVLLVCYLCLGDEMDATIMDTLR